MSTLLSFDSTKNSHGVSRSVFDVDFYVTIGITSPQWNTSTSPPTPMFVDATLIPFPDNTSSGVDITKFAARKAASYIGYKFGEVWGIREGIEYPRLLMLGQHAIYGEPGESIRNYVFVEPHLDGTMFYRGEIYKTLGMNNLISKFVGEPGEVVKHTWGGLRQRARDGKTYVYLASGVQDPDYPGGYGSYLPDTERTVTLRADRSINVNFYYIAAEMPEYNYLMRVSVPNGGFHIAILKEDVSDIKLKMPDGSICTVDIVTLEDEKASDIRVSLPTGIFALKKVVLSD